MDSLNSDLKVEFVEIISHVKTMRICCINSNNYSYYRVSNNHGNLLEFIVLLEFLEFCKISGNSLYIY